MIEVKWLAFVEESRDSKALCEFSIATIYWMLHLSPARFLFLIPILNITFHSSTATRIVVPIAIATHHSMQVRGTVWKKRPVKGTCIARTMSMSEPITPNISHLLEKMPILSKEYLSERQLKALKTS